MCLVAIFHASDLCVRSGQDKKSEAECNQAISYCLGNYSGVTLSATPWSYISCHHSSNRLFILCNLESSSSDIQTASWFGQAVETCLIDQYSICLQSDEWQWQGYSSPPAVTTLHINLVTWFHTVTSWFLSNFTFYISPDTVSMYLIAGNPIFY